MKCEYQGCNLSASCNHYCTTHHDAVCGRGESPTPVKPYQVADARHVALWDAINELVIASGGSATTMRPARQKAVAKVERALEALAVRAPGSPAGFSQPSCARCGRPGDAFGNCYPCDHPAQESP